MRLQEINPKVVQERLGHADISLTLNTYSHLQASMQENAVEKMDTLFTLTDDIGELDNIKKTENK
jgi:integrase